MNQRHTTRRRASAYVAVLGTAMALTVIGVSSLLAARLDRRATQSVTDFAQARLLAQSAVEMGFHYVRNDAAWRTTRANGVWESNRVLGNGSYSLQGVDPDDGDFQDSKLDPLVLTGTGFAGVAKYKLAVTLVAQEPPLSCLKVPLHAGNDLSIVGATITADAPLSANRTVNATTASVSADVEAVSTITGSTYNLSISPGEDPKSMPDSTVFDYYIANGTPIDWAYIPSGKIQNVLLSPASNPFGASTNPQGIYVISCAGNNLNILDARIVGTLVLLDPAAGSNVSSSVYWEPAVANYPSLLVRGKYSFDLAAASLDESVTKVNYNPLGTSFKGASDADITDTYPSKLTGLFYVSSDVTAGTNLNLQGVLVSGNDVVLNGGATLVFDEQFKNNPPPGFRDLPVMVQSPGSYRPVVD